MQAMTLRMMGQAEPASVPDHTQPPAQLVQAILPARGRMPTEAAPAAVAMATQQTVIGERLLMAVSKYKPELTERITSMLLEMEDSELRTLLDNEDEFRAKVDEAERELVHAMTLRMMGQGTRSRGRCEHAEPTAMQQQAPPTKLQENLPPWCPSSSSPTATSHPTSSRTRAQTVDVRTSQPTLLRATEAVRAIKLNLFQEARALSMPLARQADRLNSHLDGHFRHLHQSYHTARQGKATRGDGEPFTGPLESPNVGNWIWSLLAALIAHPGRHANIWRGRTQPGPLGDGVEAFLYVLYEEHTEESLSLLAQFTTAASVLHELLADIPPGVYYKLHWLQTWTSFRDCLMPWLGFDDPLAIADEQPAPEIGEGSRCRVSSTSGPKMGSRVHHDRSCMGEEYMHAWGATCEGRSPLPLLPCNMLPALLEIPLLAQVRRSPSYRRQAHWITCFPQPPTHLEYGIRSPKTTATEGQAQRLPLLAFDRARLTVSTHQRPSARHAAWLRYTSQDPVRRWVCADASAN